MKSSKRALWVSIAIVALALFSGFSLGHYRAQRQTRALLSGVIGRISTLDNKLGYTLSLIEREYIDAIPTDTLVEALMPHLVEQLDPHSVYIPARDMQAVNEPLEGEFDGIGVVFNMATDTITILNVISSGPSRKAGIEPGDRILRIDDSLVAGQQIPQEQVVKMLRGKRGSKVRLGVQRGQEREFEVEVTRDKIPVKSIEAAFMIRPKVGFIKLSQFSRTTYIELIEALAALRREGMEALLFDLRDNAGGYLDQAILVTNEFLQGEELIVYTEDRAGHQMKEYSNGRGSATDLKLAILINEGSASSSEILAGAVQDNDRGWIVGRRSFGKGLVQRQVPFADGSALRLTTARYYTPTGRSIQKPYTRGDEEGYALDMWNRYTHNEFFSADSIRFADSLKFTTPKGRTVYGGGGIMPDYFIPADTTNITPWFMEVTGRNILYRYTMEYADHHRKALNGVTTTTELQALLDADSRMVEDFLRYTEQKGVKPRKQEIEKSKPIVRAQLRAYIGRNTALEEAGFYLNIYPIDKSVLKGLEVLENELKTSVEETNE